MSTSRRSTGGYTSTPRHRYVEIRQYYLAPEVRVRATTDTFQFCIKLATEDPTTRDEVEFGVDDSVGRQLIELATHMLRKERFTVVYEGREWVVDRVTRNPSAVWVAEIELKSPEETFTKPDWVLKEVTGQPEYSSFSLASPIR